MLTRVVGMQNKDAVSDQQSPAVRPAKQYGKHQCTICGKYFCSRSSLARHIDTHTGKKPYPCLLCDSSFSQKAHLDCHMTQRHSQIRPYKCGLCDKSCKTKSHLKQHMLIHTGEKPYKCEHCHTMFTHKFSLTVHTCRVDGTNNEMNSMREASTSNSSIDAASLGESNFNDKSVSNAKNNREATANVSGLLTDHDSDDEERSLTADIVVKKEEDTFCSSDFNTLAVGSSVRRFEYKCEFCPKIWTQKQHLTEHLRVHTGEKPYSCKFCGRGFSTNNGVKKHMLIHTGETPYSCDICGRDFRHSSSLVSHKRIHTGEKSFHSCPQCGVVLKHKSYLLTHLMKHCKNRATNTI